MLAFVYPVMAMQKDCRGGAECASCHNLSTREATELLKKGGGAVKSVKQAPVPGMFELLVDKDGQQGIVYLDYGKKVLMQGLMLNLDTFEPIAAHGSPAMQPKKIAAVNPVSVPGQFAVTIGNPAAAKQLFVFTDPDCPYCRKLHAELKKLEKLDPQVAIKIMLFPLPLHPGAYDKARVILARKSRELLDMAFDGMALPPPSKDEGKEQVDAVIGYAYANGLRGTPTIIFPDGAVVVGIQDALTLKAILDRQ